MNHRGAEKSATRGCAERLGLQGWSEGLGGRDHASLASELAPIWGGCCLADCHSLRRLRPISRFFPRPSLRRQGEPGFPTAGGSASPKGEARREAPARQSEAHPHGRRQREPEGRSTARSAGKAKRSASRAREDYGWGWAGRFNQTVPGNPPKTRSPKHPRQPSRSTQPRDGFLLRPVSSGASPSPGSLPSFSVELRKLYLSLPLTLSL